jgi:rubrerythrin
MKKPTDLGSNRTGIGASPFQGKRAAEAAKNAVPTSSGGVEKLLQTRAELSREADPVGTMPPPLTVKGVAKAVVEAAKGHHMTALIDQLAERLAFERTGTRIYEAVLAKLEASEHHDEGPTREQLLRIRDEELAHFGLLTAALERLGADPTAVTPSADVTSVASSGVLAVVTDARVTLSEALKAVLVAELVDNDSWQVLVDLADSLGQPAMATAFRTALAEEQEHLASVRLWLTASIDAQIGVKEEGEPIPAS